MQTSDGTKIIKMPDGVNLPEDEGWFGPTENPFVHSCCETPLFSLLYDKDSRSKILKPAYPLYCHICGQSLIPGA